MTKTETAFPQPITPSGYELNHTNMGMSKWEYAVCLAMQGILAYYGTEIDPGKCAYYAKTYATLLFETKDTV